jgi:hypothetical protein
LQHCKSIMSKIFYKEWQIILGLHFNVGDTMPRGVHCILCLRTTCVHDPSKKPLVYMSRGYMSRYLLYTYVFHFKCMFNVSIREYFSILNVSIVCIRNTARSKSIPLLCTHVDSCKFSTVHPPSTMHAVSQLGPVQTWAKSHDHAIVRAQKKCPKASQDNFFGLSQLHGHGS